MDEQPQKQRQSGEFVAANQSSNEPYILEGSPVAGLLYGKELIWLSYDRRNLFTAHCARVIESLAEEWSQDFCQAKFRLRQVSGPEIPSEVASSNLGLVTFDIHSIDDVKPAVEIFGRVRSVAPQAILVCYLDNRMRSTQHLFLEADASLVLSDITQLRTHLRKVLQIAKWVEMGSHPLVRGITSRLPFGRRAE